MERSLVEWLSKCQSPISYVTSAKSVSVKIGRTTYEGAIFTQYFKGTSKYPDREETRLYLLSSSLPPSFKRNPGSISTPSIHYRDREGRIWYVSGYMLESEYPSFYHYSKHFDLSIAHYIEDGTKFMNITIEEADNGKNI